MSIDRNGVVGHYGYGDGSVNGACRDEILVVGFAGKIRQSFGSAVIIVTAPGSARPAVVELPVQRAHAIRLGAAMRFDGSLHSFGLLQLGNVDVIGKAVHTGGVAVIGLHIALDNFIT